MALYVALAVVAALLVLAGWAYIEWQSAAQAADEAYRAALETLERNR